MKLRFTACAIENIVAISDYIRERDPSALRHVRAAIYDALQNLILFPLAGRRQSSEGVRKLVTRRYAYLIYYTADEAKEEIVILSIKHPSSAREHSDA